MLRCPSLDLLVLSLLQMCPHALTRTFFVPFFLLHLHLLPSLLPDCTQNTDEESMSWIRRSAGLPDSILALLQAQSPDLRAASVSRSLSLLLASSSVQASPQGLSDPALTTSWTTRVHSLNVMRTLFSSSILRDELSPHVVPALISSLSGFADPKWAVRNAALLLFSAILRRIVSTHSSAAGTEAKSRSNDEGSAVWTGEKALWSMAVLKLEERGGESITRRAAAEKNWPNCWELEGVWAGSRAARGDHVDRQPSIPSHTFFSCYPGLCDFFLTQLRLTTTTSTSTSDVADLHPTLYPILLLLSRLTSSAPSAKHTPESPSPPSQTTGPKSVRDPTAPFLPLLASCAGINNYSARYMAAKALSSLVSPNDAPWYIFHLIRCLRSLADSSMASFPLSPSPVTSSHMFPSYPVITDYQNQLHGMLLQLHHLLLRQCDLHLPLAQSERSSFDWLSVLHAITGLKFHLAPAVSHGPCFGVRHGAAVSYVSRSLFLQCWYCTFLLACTSSLLSPSASPPSEGISFLPSPSSSQLKPAILLRSSAKELLLAALAAVNEGDRASHGKQRGLGFVALRRQGAAILSHLLLRPFLLSHPAGPSPCTVTSTPWEGWLDAPALLLALCRDTESSLVHTVLLQLLAFFQSLRSSLDPSSNALPVQLPALASLLWSRVAAASSMSRGSLAPHTPQHHPRSFLH